MVPGALLPEDIYPYITLMFIGFAVGAFGHLTRSRLMILIGILLIFIATLLFPIAVNVVNDEPPEPPGPVAEP